MEQEIHFCTTDDKVRIAYATVGAGPPLVKAANWLSHLEFDWSSPIWRHLLAEFARDHKFIRYEWTNCPAMNYKPLLSARVTGSQTVKAKNYC